MRLKYYFILGFIFSITFKMLAQDVHYSRFYDSPLQLNPAKAGDYFGTLKLGGIYRAQNYNSKNVYSTPDVYIDAPIINGFLKTHWVGVGINLIVDDSGSDIVRSGIAAALAYHIGLDKKMENSISIGLSGGKYKIDPVDKNSFIFGDFLSTGNASEDATLINESQINYFDINTGIQFNGKISESGNLKLGFSLNHLNRPKFSFLKDNKYRLPVRTNIYGNIDVPFNNLLDIISAAYFSTISSQREFAIQCAGGLKLNPLKGFRIIGGLGYRFTDGIQVIGGIDYKNLKFGFSYDPNQNSKKPNGAYEVSISKVFMFYKKPKDNPQLLCPRI